MATTDGNEYPTSRVCHSEQRRVHHSKGPPPRLSSYVVSHASLHTGDVSMQRVSIHGERDLGILFPTSLYPTSLVFNSSVPFHALSLLYLFICPLPLLINFLCLNNALDQTIQSFRILVITDAIWRGRGGCRCSGSSLDADAEEIICGRRDLRLPLLRPLWTPHLSLRLFCSFSSDCPLYLVISYSMSIYLLYDTFTLEKNA
jgi:hypothetical protein